MHLDVVACDWQVKFGNTTFKTDVCPKSLNPQWNSEWFKFEVSVSFECDRHWWWCLNASHTCMNWIHCASVLFLLPFLCFLSPLLALQVDDEDLQDEPLQITVLDHDTYSANDAIGKVYIDIDPLLCSEAASVISGWFPIYDTIHGMNVILPGMIITMLCLFLIIMSPCLLLSGIRGEINVLVKVELFNDLNRFRQSSCGVKFFCSTSETHHIITHSLFV